MCTAHTNTRTHTRTHTETRTDAELDSELLLITFALETTHTDQKTHTNTHPRPRTTITDTHSHTHTPDCWSGPATNGAEFDRRRVNISTTAVRERTQKQRRQRSAAAAAARCKLELMRVVEFYKRAHLPPETPSTQANRATTTVPCAMARVNDAKKNSQRCWSLILQRVHELLWPECLWRSEMR